MVSTWSKIKTKYYPIYIYIYIYIYIHTHTHTHIYIYIYIYIWRDIENERERELVFRDEQKWQNTYDKKIYCTNKIHYK